MIQNPSNTSDHAGLGTVRRGAEMLASEAERGGTVNVGNARIAKHGTLLQAHRGQLTYFLNDPHQ